MTLRKAFVSPLELIRADPSENVRDADAADVEVGQLAATIREHGQLHPLIVRPTTHAGYTWDLVAGFRRHRALRVAGIKEAFCVEWTGPVSGVREAENIARKPMTEPEILEAVRALSKKLDAATVALRTGLKVERVEQYVRVARRLIHPVLVAWRRSPGAFRLDELDQVATLSSAKQSEWFYGRTQRDAAAALPPPKREAPKRHGRSPAEVAIQIYCLERGERWTQHSEEWRRGALHALRWSMRRV